jgi:hypothetical protein
MRKLALALLATASAATAQPPAWRPGMPWDPAGPYVTLGQDLYGFQRWSMGAQWRPAYVTAFNDYLTSYGVAGIVPTWQLLRTATDWEKCGTQPFDVPPPNDWPNVVQTLRYIRDQVIPRIGPVEPVSVYRNGVLNRCAGGARESAHRFMQAIDLVPLRPTTRDAMIRRLCAVHARNGQYYGVGLGFYVGLRFHVDSRKFRTWGVNDEGTIACARSYEIAHAKPADADAAEPIAQSASGQAPAAQYPKIVSPTKP